MKELEDIFEAMETSNNAEKMGKKKSIVFIKKGKTDELEETRVEEKERKGSFESSMSEFAP